MNLKIGAVPYINALPLTYFFQPKSSLIFQAPAILEEMILEKKLDIALCSSITSFKNPSLIPLWDCGIIQSNGPVKSVCFFYKEKFKKPWEVESIGFTPDSKTSVALLRIIFKKLWLKDSTKLASDNNDPDGFLEIGDKALFFDKPGYTICDLGEVWKNWTGFPFIYAFWMSQKKIENSLKEKLVQARSEGLQKIEEIIQSIDINQDKKLIYEYLTKNINYELHNNSLKGLDLFRKYCTELKLI